MTTNSNNQSSPQFWSAPLERVVVMAMLCFCLLCIVAAVVILAYHGDIDKASVTAILGSIAGTVGTTLVHRLSTRSTDNGR